MNELDMIKSNSTKSILQELFNNKVTTRAEISRSVGLNKSTISSIYENLKQLNLVEELGEGEASNLGGRKPTKIRINANYGFTVSFDISFHNLHYMANLLNGEIVAQGKVSIYGDETAKILKIIDDKINHFLATVKTDRGLLGICFSVHGVIDGNQIIYSPFVDLENIDLHRMFAEKYKVPVLIENESNLVALYARDFLNKNTIENLIVVSIHKGIGSGVIINGNLFRGFHGQAGEIGQMLVSQNDGTYTDIEKLWSEDAMIKSLAKLLNVDTFSRELLIKYLNEKNNVVEKVIEDFVSEIARSVYNISKFCASDTVYLCSPLMEEEPLIFQKVTKKVGILNQKNNRSFEIKLNLIDYSNQATLLGACSLITHHVLHLDNYDLNFN